MEEQEIFGSNVTLPSLPDLQSACEAEILFLMKEVDLEFQRKNHSLLEELSNIRSLCQAQRDEIRALKGSLQSNNEEIHRDRLREKIQECSLEIEKLQKENFELRTENNQLRRSFKIIPEDGFELERLKRRLSLQEEENKILQQKLSKAEEQYQHLQNKKMEEAYVSFRQNCTQREISPGKDLLAANFKEAKMTELTEKLVSDENTLCQDFLFKLDRKIEDLEKEMRK